MPRFLSDKISVTPRFYIVASATLLLLPIEWLLSWIVAVLVHELGHIIAISLLKIPIRGVIFDSSGIMIKTGNMCYWEEIFSAISGPLVGMIPLLVTRKFPHIAICALVLSCVNLLPLYPLDGGRVLCSAMAIVFGAKVANQIRKYIAITMICVLTVSAVVAAVRFRATLPGIILFLLFVFRNLPQNVLAKQRR